MKDLNKAAEEHVIANFCDGDEHSFIIAKFSSLAMTESFVDGANFVLGQTSEGFSEELVANFYNLHGGNWKGGTNDSLYRVILLVSRSIWQAATLSAEKRIQELEKAGKIIIESSEEQFKKGNEAVEALSAQLSLSQKREEVLRKALRLYAKDEDPCYIYARDNASEHLMCNHNVNDDLINPLGTWARAALREVESIK